MIDVTTLFADDMGVFDFLQSGVFHSRSPGDTFTPYPDITCLRRVINKRPTSVGMGVVQQDSAVWHIKKSDMDTNGLTPQFLDRIEDSDGVFWYIEKYTLETFSTRYRCDTNRVKSP